VSAELDLSLGPIPYEDTGGDLALQESLLPRGLPGQAAVEAASRYLPAGSQAGVGGDWVDVIPR
jgi:serine phosphatase RsbU (regulator of sigma subunit)